MLERLICVDTETTGLDHTKNDVLSIAMVVLDIKESGLASVGASIEVKVKHDNYRVSPKALEVNKIDLVQHDKEAVQLYTASKQLGHFLGKAGVDEDHKAIFIGHNIDFDIPFIKHVLFEDFYSQNISHRKVDTSSIGRFLYHAGLVPKNLGSSDDLFEFFLPDPDLPENTRHTALGDAKRLAFAYCAILNFMRKR